MGKWKNFKAIQVGQAKTGGKSKKVLVEEGAPKIDSFFSLLTVLTAKLE